MHRRHGDCTKVARRLAVGVLLACAAGPAPRERAALTNEFRDLERQVARLVNEHRAVRRLSRLTYDTTVAAIARTHSVAMAERRVTLGHDGFEQRAAAVEPIRPFTKIAENVALNDYAVARTATVALQGWLRSAHHLENIEGAFDVTGVGVARAEDGTFYFTQLFVARRR
jgi:uncharacterized protein YkwD